MQVSLVDGQRHNEESSSDSEEDSSDEENAENDNPRVFRTQGTKRGSLAPLPSESKILKQANT